MDINTKYGMLYNCYNIAYHKNGQLSECICQKESPLSVGGVEFMPYYTDNDRRKPSPSAKFYPDGSIKSLYLENRTEVKTPCGIFPAELITFYPGGRLRRVFPLNGRISEYWSEENETKLIGKMSFSFSSGDFSARPMALHFYESDKIKSLTLQPPERIEIATPLGRLKVKCGVSFYPDGSLQSAEPALPQKLTTPIGLMTVFDPDSIGVSADASSLRFTPEGALKSLKTTSTIAVIDESGRQTVIEPARKSHPLNEKAVIILPLTLRFADQSLTIVKSNSEEIDLALGSCRFTIK